MTGSASSAKERIAEVVSKARLRTQARSEELVRTRKEMAAKTAEMRERNQQKCKEADQRAAERAAAREADGDGKPRDSVKSEEADDRRTSSGDNPWTRKRSQVKAGADSIITDGEADEAVDPAPAASTAPPSRGRHAKPDDYDDEEDTSTLDWLR